MSERRQRKVTREESRLWAHMVGDVAPLRRPKASVVATRESSSTSGRDGEASNRADPRAIAALRREMAAGARPSGKKRSSTLALPPEEKQLQHMDKRNALRLRKGQMQIEATLDLHGHSQAQAHTELNDFLMEAFARRLRCILVITGKGPLPGRTSGYETLGWDEEVSPEGLQVERRGVLRRMLPHWLSEPRNRTRILAWHPARGRHGGSGAFYVMLRRQRN